MHVFQFKGNNSGIHVQAWLFKKRLEHYSCWTIVFALSKAEIYSPSFSIFIMHFKLCSCILSSEYVIHWMQKSLRKEVGVTWKSYWC